MSVPKEIGFFASQPNQAKSIGWYLEHFRRSEAYRAVGEFSPSYLQRPAAAEQIKNTAGHVKILVMLRDPVDRFISHYKQLIRNGQLSKKEYNTLETTTFHRATEKFPTLLDYGNYNRNLMRFVDRFGAENVCVVLMEDIHKNPRSQLEKVYDFLEVDRDYIPPILNKKVSPGIVPRFPSLEKLRIQLFHTLNQSAPRLIVYSRKVRLGEVYRMLNSDNRRGQFEVKSEVFEKLSANYRDEIAGIEDFLGRQLNVWKSRELLASRLFPTP
jgi:hypothetical protein